MIHKMHYTPFFTCAVVVHATPLKNLHKSLVFLIIVYNNITETFIESKLPMMSLFFKGDLKVTGAKTECFKQRRTTVYFEHQSM